MPPDHVQMDYASALSMGDAHTSRALVVCANFPFPVISGGRKRAVRLMESMHRAGAKPYILALDDDSGGLDEARARGWSAEVFPPPRYSFSTRLRQHLRTEPVGMSALLANRIRQLGAASAFIQLEEIDVAQYVRLALTLAPTAVSLHNVDSAARGADRRDLHGLPRARAEYHHWRLKNVERRAARRGDALICVSPADRAYFIRAGSRRVVLAPNGIDAQLLKIPATAGRSDDVLFFGQLAWPPNLDGLRRFLAEGWPAVLSKVPGARLRIAGPGADRTLGRSVPTTGVDVVGFVDDIGDELARVRAVVAPIWEGGGTRIKVLEAMAAGRPVVGTPLAVEEIGFQDRVHGLVGDTPVQLAEHLATLLQKADLATRLGSAARERAREFEWRLATAEAQRLYAEWIGIPDQRPDPETA